MGDFTYRIYFGINGGLPLMGLQRISFAPGSPSDFKLLQLGNMRKVDALLALVC